MEKKRGDDVQKPDSSQKVPKEPPTQTKSKRQETQEKAIYEETPGSKKKQQKKPQDVMDGKATSEEVISTKKPRKRREGIMDERPTDTGTKKSQRKMEAVDEKTANEETTVPSMKLGKKLEGTEETIANAENTIAKKKSQKKQQVVIESTTKKQPLKTADADVGKPIRTEEDDAIQKTKKLKKSRRGKEEENINLSQGTAIRMQEPALQSKAKTEKTEKDKSVAILPSDSIYRDTSGPDESKTKPESPAYSPETFTGLDELPARNLFVIFILWLPRFFIPWMRDWHEYNVFILVNPDLYGQHVEDLFKHDMILLVVKCLVGIACSIVADFANMRYYVYLVLILLFIFCPVSGGVVDMVLRSRTYDQHYYSYWLWCIIMMRWAMAIPFVITPVQFACIFLEKKDMSRKAHYNWTGIFIFFEFVNAYASFWLIPAKCPTKDWIQIAVWVGIGMLTFIVIFFTIIIFLLIKETRATFMTCLKICGKHRVEKLEEVSEKPRTESTPNVGKAHLKLILFVLMLTPLVYMSFVFSVLDRFLPDDDWDKHKSLSATSMFVLGKIIGVLVMVITMFVIRKFGKVSRLGKIGKFVQKIARFKFFSMDVMVLGLPHALNILALFVLVGRFETLTNGYAIKEGHEHFGPIPDSSKTVVLFFNLMLSNRTICVGSEHFHSVKIRPFRYAAVEVFDPGVDSVNITITPEPGSTPVVATSFAMTNFRKGKWIAYTISIFNDVTKYVKHKTGPKNYYAKPRVVRLRDSLVNSQIRPDHFPVLIIPNNYNDVTGQYKYWIKYEGVSELYSLKMKEQSSPNIHRLPMDPYIWEFVGCCNYSISISDPDANKPDYKIPWYTFRVNSIHRWPLYYLLSYLHTPIDPKKHYNASELPVWFKMFLVAETARWDNQAHLPHKAELQQDWAIKLGLSLAGMAAGGVFVGVTYVFWTDLPFPKFPATTMAVFWAFWVGAAEPARLKLIDIDPPTETVVMTLPAKLLTAHIPFTALHFVAATFFYHPKFNFRERPD